MTWTNTHTITYVDGTSNHDALVYLHDTYLSGKSMFTVGAHPDASAFKRKVTVTVNDAISGSTANLYWWTNWAGVSNPSTFSVYNDNTYTTVPGDLCTSVTNVTSYSNLQLGASPWRFWTSDVDANACLVTRGKQTVFYWPGNNDFNIYPQSNWDGSSGNLGTYILPYTNTNFSMLHGGYPVVASLTGTEYLALTSPIKIDSSYNSFSPNVLYKGFSWNYGKSTSYSYSSSGNTLMTSVATDQGVLHTDSATDNPGSPFTGAGNGSLVLVNSTEYWFAACSLSKSPICFYMGTSEPDLT